MFRSVTLAFQSSEEAAMSREENDRMLRAMLQRAMTGMKRRSKPDGGGGGGGGEEAAGQSEGAAAAAVPNGLEAEGKDGKENCKS